MKPSFPLTLPPHLRSSDSLSGRTLKTAAALLPLIILAIALLHLQFLKIFAACAAGILSAKLMGIVLLNQNKKHGLFEIPALFLLSLLLPPQTPFPLIVFMVAAVFLITKECFGGLGGVVFHPVPLVYAALAFYSKEFSLSMASSFCVLENFYQTPWVWVLTAVFLLSGILMMGQRLILWELPLIYAGFLLVPGKLLLGEMFSWGWFCLAAFFLLADTETTPTTRTGLRFYAGAAGLLTLIFSRAMEPGLSVAYAFLIMNSLTPWMDRLLVPETVQLKVPTINLIESEAHAES